VAIILAVGGIATIEEEETTVVAVGDTFLAEVGGGELLELVAIPQLDEVGAVMEEIMVLF